MKWGLMRNKGLMKNEGLMKFSYLFLISFFILGSAGFAKEDMESASKEQVGSAIDKAYVQIMNKWFLELVNLSKTSKDQKEFFSHVIKPTNLEKYTGLKVPLIYSIKDGIEFTVDGQKTTIVLSSKSGILKINGEESISFANNFSTPPPTYSSFLELFESPAEAQLTQLLEASMTLEKAKGFADMMRSLLRVVGWSAATGAPVGCLAGIGFVRFTHTGDISKNDTLIACGAGAAALSTGVAFSSLAGAAGVMVWEDVEGFEGVRVFRNVSGAPKAVREAGLLKVISTIGIIGVTGKFFDPVAFADGARLICDDGGDFKYRSYGEPERGYSVGHCSLEPCLSNPPKDDELIGLLNNNNKLRDQDKKNILPTLRNEVRQHSETCKKHGFGYTTVFRFMPGKSVDALSPKDSTR
jgi:hypothetical protein